MTVRVIFKFFVTEITRTPLYVILLKIVTTLISDSKRPAWINIRWVQRNAIYLSQVWRSQHRHLLTHSNMIKRRYQRMQSVKNSERIKKTAHTHIHTLNTPRMPNVWKKKTIIQNIDNETELFTYTKKIQKDTEWKRVSE